MYPIALLLAPGPFVGLQLETSINLKVISQEDREDTGGPSLSFKREEGGGQKMKGSLILETERRCRRKNLRLSSEGFQRLASERVRARHLSRNHSLSLNK